MKIVIYSSFPCLIKYNGEEENIDENQHLELDYSSGKISVYPLEKDTRPFDIDLSATNPLYRVIEKDNKTLVFLLGGLFAENIICHSFDYQGEKSAIEVSQDKIVFVGVKDKKIIHLSKPLQEVKVGAFQFITYCSFKENEQSVLIAYNPKKNTSKVFYGDKIEIEKEGFSVHKTCFNYKDIEEKYYIDSEGLKVKNKSFISAQSLPSPVETLSYRFMNAIKCGDWKGGKNMLSSSLSQKLNLDSLKEYFGDISYFYMLSPTTAFAISDNKNVIYEFSVSDDKITEIND